MLTRTARDGRVKRCGRTTARHVASATWLLPTTIVHGNPSSCPLLCVPCRALLFRTFFSTQLSRRLITRSDQSHKESSFRTAENLISWPFKAQFEPQLLQILACSLQLLGFCEVLGVLCMKLLPFWRDFEVSLLGGRCSCSRSSVRFLLCWGRLERNAIYNGGHREDDKGSDCAALCGQEACACGGVPNYLPGCA